MYAGASLWSGRMSRGYMAARRFAVNDGGESRLENCVYFTSERHRAFAPLPEHPARNAREWSYAHEFTQSLNRTVHGTWRIAPKCLVRTAKADPVRIAFNLRAAIVLILEHRREDSMRAMPPICVAAPGRLQARGLDVHPIEVAGAAEGDPTFVLPDSPELIAVGLRKPGG